MKWRISTSKITLGRTTDLCSQKVVRSVDDGPGCGSHQLHTGLDWRIRTSFEDVDSDLKEESVFESASRHETRAATKGAPTACSGMMPKKLQNEKRAEWKRDDPGEYGTQESRRHLWLDAKSCTKRLLPCGQFRVGQVTIRKHLDVLTMQVDPSALRAWMVRPWHVEGLRIFEMAARRLPWQRLPRWRYGALAPRALS